jgi:hypothetical protein
MKIIKFNFEEGKASVKEDIKLFYEKLIDQLILDFKYILTADISNNTAIQELESGIQEVKEYMEDRDKILTQLAKATNLQQVLKASESIPHCELTILSYFTDRSFIEDKGA